MWLLMSWRQSTMTSAPSMLMKYSTLWDQFQTIYSVWFNPYATRNTRVHTQQCGRWRPGVKSTMPTAPECWSAIHLYGISFKQYTQCGLTLKQLIKMFTLLDQFHSSIFNDLTPKPLEMHGCILSTVAADVLVSSTRTSAPSMLMK